MLFAVHCCCPIEKGLRDVLNVGVFHANNNIKRERAVFLSSISNDGYVPFAAPYDVLSSVCLGESRPSKLKV
jgi:hypothetical protein